MSLNLYKVERTDEFEYDTYRRMVVAANSEEEAIDIHPRSDRDTERGAKDTMRISEMPERELSLFEWNYKELKVTLIGKADKKIQEPTCILAEYILG